MFRTKPRSRQQHSANDHDPLGVRMPELRPSSQIDRSIAVHEQESLIHAFESIRKRLHQRLPYAEVIRSPTFWLNIQRRMTAPDCSAAAVDADAGDCRSRGPIDWKLVWLKMQAKLLSSIDASRRRGSVDVAWLSPLSVQLLSVLLDELDADRHAYVRQCLEADVPTDDAIACAIVYHDTVAQRYVWRCHRCRLQPHVFSDISVLIQHMDSHHKRQRHVVDELTAPNECVQSDGNGTSGDHNDANDSVANDSDANDSDANDNDNADDSNADEAQITIAAIALPAQSVQAAHACAVAECAATFGTEQELNEHTVAMHGRRAFGCSFEACAFTTTRLSYLQMHEAKHDRTFQCDICKRFYPHINGIRVHMRVHETTNRFACADCAQTFRYAWQRSRHRRSAHPPPGADPPHPAHGNHVCERCGQSFQFAGKLVAHLARHSGAREHRCHVCGQHYNSRRYLTKHLRNVHGTRAQGGFARYDGHPHNG